MAVRVFVALLVSDDGRRTAAELAEMLRVSPAAVSNAVRYLQQVRLVAREREPGERRDNYRVYSGDTRSEVITRRDEMLTHWQDTPAGKRLEETRLFYEFMHSELPLLIEKWRKLRSESAADKAG
jgi:predicted transcriptional regulator